MDTAQVTLICAECGKTFTKPHDVIDHHTMVACPHCATLQHPRLESDPGAVPGAGLVKPSYRKGP